MQRNELVATNFKYIRSSVRVLRRCYVSVGLCVQMAVEKLAQGIEGFSVDQRKLETLLAQAAEQL